MQILHQIVYVYLSFHGLSNSSVLVAPPIIKAKLNFLGKMSHKNLGAGYLE